MTKLFRHLSTKKVLYQLSGGQDILCLCILLKIIQSGIFWGGNKLSSVTHPESSMTSSTIWTREIFLCCFLFV